MQCSDPAASALSACFTAAVAVALTWTLPTATTLAKRLRFWRSFATSWYATKAWVEAKEEDRKGPQEMEEELAVWLPISRAQFTTTLTTPGFLRLHRAAR